MPENKEASFNTILRNRLKGVDTTNLERAIAEALSQLIDTKLECSIESIDYKSGYPSTRAKISLSLYEPIDTSFLNQSKKSS